jgi:hypothetical protein
MPIRGSITERFARVETAFAADGFRVRYFPDPVNPGRSVGYRERNGRIGVRAEHTTAINTSTGRAKKAFYVEGNNAEMGYLLGLLAEDDVSAMTTAYVENIIFAFFNLEAATESGILEPLRDLLIRLVVEDSQEMAPDVPVEYVEEMQGILEGCRTANPNTLVEWGRLWALNFGVDCVLSHVYTGKLFAERGVQPRVLRAPVGCNAFFLSAAAAEGGKHLFGRDFMFPTANVFQDTACLIVYNPDDRDGRPRQAFVSQTAPGFVGTMTALNSSGVAIGVNMTASPFCDPGRPGFNSLPLNRDCAQYCSSAAEAVERITRAQRGVAWIYPVGDRNGKSYIVEAGRKVPEGEPFPYFDYVPRYFRRRLPGRRYIERMRSKFGTPGPQAGMIARASDYPFPTDYLTDWNRGLYRAFNRNLVMKLRDFLLDLAGILIDAISGKLSGLWSTLKKEVEEMFDGAHYSAEAFGERGSINARWTDSNCPGPFYFSPQRESRPDVIIATNHYISPEMRLTAMNEWTAVIASANLNDFQWRYDTLNRAILEALEASPGGITDTKAWQLINFLNPKDGTPEYYNPDGAQAWKDVQVHGSVSLCELSGRSIKSLFGYYGDAPVTLHLMSYL